MANIYKAMLNTIVEPICETDQRELLRVAHRLRHSCEESKAVAEMLERAIRYIEMTVALTEEEK